MSGKLMQAETFEISTTIPLTSKPRLVIVGGGFGGIRLARDLKHLDANIILIDKNNYHTFQPLLYQVATAALEPESIAYPFREIFRGHRNFHFRMAEVRQIVPDENKVNTSIGDISYDYLVLAAGSKTNYFGMEDFQANARPMKSIVEARQLRNCLLENMEKALLASTLEQRQRLMNIVIVGGGPTGVEMAGALAELKNTILPRDYPELNFKAMQIHLVDMSDRILNTMSGESSQSATSFLRNFDVNLWLATKVIDYDGKILRLSNGKQIATETVIWAAGVSGVVFPGLKNAAQLPGGRLKVNPYNQLEGYSNIFVIGDMACMITKETPKGHPMLAPVAIQQAHNLARNFVCLLNKKPLNPFVYRNHGVMATVGRNHAVVELNFMKFHGLLAWLVWLFVHLMTLVGFRNRLVVFVNWTWNYFTYDRGLRLIIK